MKKHILIVDSDDKQINRIEKVVRRTAIQGNKRFEIYAANTISDAVIWLEGMDIDLLILDTVYRGIKPGEYPGIELVKRLRLMSKYLFLPVIFVASVQEPEVYAYKELNCLGFLNRTFSAEKLSKIVSRALHYTTYRDWENYILPRKQGILYTIKVKYIIYVEMKERLLFIHQSRDGVLEIPHKTLKKLQEESRSKCLIRCNRSTLVNRLYVQEVNLLEQYIILKESGLKIPIGVRYRETVRKGFCMREKEHMLLT